MDYTKEKNHLDSLYAAAHLSLDSKNILEIPTFVYIISFTVDVI